MWLVGAGPGDPRLLTLRGAECLSRANVVVYDRLTHPALLKHISTSAELIYVGKESSRHTLRQEEINSLLVAKATAGLAVCRLKGGDPFVFGRGGEEAEACLAAGIRFEVVPGVSSSIAAPAYAGIPVTHRNVASSFAVITGHEDPARADSRIRWEHLALGVDTLIFLMGVENLHNITENLIMYGRSPETPVALVRWGTWPAQETLVSSLGKVVEDVQSSGFSSPAVTVVGEVVRLREKLKWFENLPLFGKRILVTRAREQASTLISHLRELGAEPVEYPVIRIHPVEDMDELDNALTTLATDRNSYRWVIFTSINAVQIIAGRMEKLGFDARIFSSVKVAAIGDATAGGLKYIGLRADFVPSRFVAESIINEWPDRDMQNGTILLPRAREAREILPEQLTDMDARVQVVPIYDTVLDSSSSSDLQDQIRQGKLDIITFTSSSTVRYFVQALGKDAFPLPGHMKIVSIGPITSATARDMGMTVHLEALQHDIPGVVEAVCKAARLE